MGDYCLICRSAVMIYYVAPLKTYGKDVLALGGAHTEQAGVGRRLGDSVRGLGNVGEVDT
jgi:hypothetical protein